MKVHLRQNGYTLLLTLIIVVLLFFVTTTFSMASINQKKQIDKTDDNFVATSLVEMGSEHIFAQTNKIFNNNQEALIRDINNIDKTLTSEEYVDRIEDAVDSREITAATQIVEFLRSLSISTDDNRYYTSVYESTNFSLQSEVNSFLSTNKLPIIVFGKSNLNSASTKKSMDLTIEIPESLGIKYTSNTESSGTSVASMTHNSLKCGVSVNCIEGSKEFSNKQAPHLNDIYYKGSITFNKLDPKSKKPADLDGSNLSKKTINVLTEDTIIINHNKAFIYKALIVANSLYFKSDSGSPKTTFEYSTIVVNNISIKKEKNKVITLNNSKLCVLDSQWNYDDNYSLDLSSKIYIYDPSKYNSAKLNDSLVFLNKEKFQQLCNVTITTTQANTLNKVLIETKVLTPSLNIKYN